MRRSLCRWAIPEPLKIEGETLNYSSDGILLIGRGGRVRVTLNIRDKTYRGQLVRAFSEGPETTEYAIVLEDELEEPVAADVSPPPDDGQGKSVEARNHAKEVERFLTAEEAAAYLRVHQRTLYRLLKAGKIPGVRVGRQWRFRRSELGRWLGGGRSTDDRI